MTIAKFLVLNPDPENLDKVLQKANVQNRKNGPFDAIILLGDVLPTDQVELPSTQMEVPSYFTAGNKAFSTLVDDHVTEGDVFADVAPNLIAAVAPFSFIKLQSGSTLGIINGQFETSNTIEQIKQRDSAQCDILITYNWPQSIADKQQRLGFGNSIVDEIVKLVRPRYHFCVGDSKGEFLELQPFMWADSTYTRFISLGQEGSGSKWFYAFNLSSEVSSLDPEQLIENPFLVKSENGIESDTITNKRPFEKEDKIVKKRKVVNPEQCYFCLSNPKVETHMIISIGGLSYMTIAKGPLTKANNKLPFSGHALIIPIDHVPSLRQLAIDSKVEENKIYQEMEKYEASIVEAFHQKFSLLRLVFFEISRLDNIHHCTQFVPIPEQFIGKFADVLNQKSKINNETYTKNAPLEFQEFESTSDPKYSAIINDSDYLLFKVYYNENATINKKIYIAPLPSEGGATVDLQFPRRVLAYILMKPNRVYWEKCRQPVYRETHECEEFKKFFQPFDFTMS